MKSEHITQYQIDFGKKVREFRMKRGLSQEELAIKVGFKGRASISRIELGETYCNKVTTEKLANALGVTSDQLCGSEEPLEKQIDYCTTISNYSFEEELLIELYRKLDTLGKRKVINFLKTDNENRSDENLA